MARFWLLLLFVLSACNVANGPKVVESGTVTSAVSMSFASVNATRGEGVGYTTMLITLSGSLTEDLTINYNASGTATGGAACTAGVDYVSPSGVAIIPAGGRNASFDLQICPDSLYEGNETLIFTLASSAPSISIGASGTSTLTILDAATPPGIRFTSASAGSFAEGSSGVTVVPIDIELPYQSVFSTTVQIVNSGTATLGTDYTLSATSVTFPPFTTTATIYVTINGDDVIEPNETVVLSLFGPVNGTIGTQPVTTLTITADEVPSPIQISNLGIAPQAESAGTVNMLVSVNGTTDHAVTFQYTIDYVNPISTTQRALPNLDFSLPGYANGVGTITIPATHGATVNIPITILNDALKEPSESVILRLIGGPEVNVSGAAAGELVITDNDTAPLISFQLAAQTVSESNTVQGAVIRLLDPSGSGVEVPVGEDVVITLGSSNGTTNSVVGRTDWTQGLGSITIPAGASRVTLPFSALPDLIDEDDEYFDLTLTPPTGYTAVAGGASQRVTILDGDPAAKVNFSASTYPTLPVNEATAATLAQVFVELDALSERTITVNYAVSGVASSTAACGAAGQRLSVPGSFTIPPNSTMPFAIPSFTVCNDTLYEGDQTAVVRLVSADHGILGAALTHTIPITEDDATPTLAITAAAANYDESAGSGSFSLAVGATGKPFTLYYTVTGTATGGSDYVLTSPGAISVSASSSSQTIPLPFSIINDIIPENDETIIVTITADSSDANVTAASATVTINANDPLQLAVGRRHTCGVLSGRVKCWGYGPVLGQGFGSAVSYGDAAGETVSALQAVALGTGFTPVKVVAGNDFSCALSSAGSVKCWGTNLQGELGQDKPGTAGTSSEFIGDTPSEMGVNLPAVSLGAVATDIQTSSNASHTCALLSTGRMKCWGLNSSGQLGYAFAAGACSSATPNTACVGDDFGDVANSAFLTFPSNAGATVLRMAVGDNHTCAHLSTGVVMCWGDNTTGALGADTADVARVLTPVSGYVLASAVNFNAAFSVSNLVNLSANTDRGCATFNNSGTYESVCWGAGANGVLGQNSSTNAGTVANPLASVSTPIVHAPFTVLTSGIKLGNDFACLRGSSVAANVLCWGNNANSSLGSAGGPSTDDPNDGAALGPFTDVYTGTNNACAVSGALQYVCWGLNTSGSAGALSGAAVTAPGTARDFL